MALPEIKASDEVDCSPDSIKIVLSIRALISVANYNYVQSEGEEKRKDGNAMWHDRGVSSWARRRKIRDRREKILFLARECPPPFTSEGLRAVNEQATGPSLPGSPLHRFVRSRLLSHCVRLSVCLSIAPFRLPHFSIPHSLFLFLKEERRELLLIYDKTDDDPVAQFPRRDLRNPSRRRETKGEKKENARQWTNTPLCYNLRDVSWRSNGSRVAAIKKSGASLSSEWSHDDVVAIFSCPATWHNMWPRDRIYIFFDTLVTPWLLE